MGSTEVIINNGFYDQKPPFDPPSSNEGENSNTEAMRKVFLFVDKLFAGNVPLDLKERMYELTRPETVIESTEELEKRRKEKKKSIYVLGFYDSEEDKIYLKDHACLNEKIHEMFHFLSARRDENGTLRSLGLFSTKFPHQASNLLNEGATELLTVIAEHDINILTRRLALLLPDKIRNLRRSGKLESSMSYKYALDTILNELNGMAKLMTKGKVDTRLFDMIPELAKAYLTSDSQRFFDAIDQRIPVKIGKKASEKFMVRLEEKPKEDIDFIRRQINICIDYFLLSGSRPKEAKRLMRMFKEMISGKNVGIDFRFEYPEDASGMIAIDPSLKYGLLKKTIPSVKFNLGFRYFLENPDFKKEYLNPKQMEAYLLWQAVKIEKAKKGEIYENNQFYQDPTILDYLVSLGIDRVHEVNSMTIHLLGTQVTREVIEKLIDMDIKRRNHILYEVIQEVKRQGRL